MPSGRPQNKQNRRSDRRSKPTSTTRLVWRSIAIADGAPAVGFARLGGNRASGAFCALVRFPVRWSRPYTGCYAAEEEMLVLEGKLAMSGAVYDVGDYACFPPGYVRSQSETECGALAVAFFSGPAEWMRVPQAEAVTISVRPVASRDIVPRPSPIAASARPLHEDETGSTWLIDGPLVAEAPRDLSVEIVSLPDSAWVAVEAGALIPNLPGPRLCRLRRAPLHRT